MGIYDNWFQSLRLHSQWVSPTQCVGSAKKTDLEAQRAAKSKGCATQGKRRQSMLEYAWEDARELVSGKSSGKSVCV